jgi:hypothetical protein
MSKCFRPIELQMALLPGITPRTLVRERQLAVMMMCLRIPTRPIEARIRI